jgi:thymidylate synthase (FAD)
MYPKYEDIVNAKLVSYTQAAPTFLESESLDDLGVQDLISYAARVSNPSNQNNFETSDKLIQYLVKHKHWSPFEMVNVCLEITSTRDIIRQLLRHKSMCFQEHSQRYSNISADLSEMFCLRECRMQDSKNRQNSTECNEKFMIDSWNKLQSIVIQQAHRTYKSALDNGVAKEQARCVLPEGNTISRVYANSSIRSWLHYLEIRTGVETQKEHRLMAQRCANEIVKVFPMIKEFCK